MAKIAELVGRTFELEQLEATLDQIGEGRAACVAVEGEPGIGKTHLLGELRRRAESRGYLVLTAAAAEFERDVPFAVWVEALDAYVASRDPRADESWDSGLSGELAAVLPSSARAAGAATLPDERYRTHRAVRRLLELIAAGRPLVVVLDDLHWIDAASNEVLVSLLHRKPAAPILLALGFRSGKAPAKLVPALAGGSASVLELSPLSEDQCARLAGDAFDVGQRAAIFEESGGNPFYMLELARAARVPARSALGHRVAEQADVPPLVAATLLDEVHSMSPHGRLVLECASIAGDPFEPELAFAIAALESSTGIEALDELLDAGLVHPTGVPRRFGFRHPLVRRAVYASTKGGWRLDAHSRAAAALARLGAPATAQANHVEQSAAVGDVAGISVLLEAGQASAAGNPEGALRWFDAALRLIPSAEPQLRLDTLMRKADALRSIGRIEECRTTLLAAIELVPERDVSLRVGLTALVAFCENLIGRHEQARRRLETALSELPDAGSSDAVAVMNYLASGAFFTMELDRMRDTAAAALAAARKLGDRGLAGSAAAQLTHSHTLSGRVAEAEAILMETTALLDGQSDAELAPHLEAVNTLGWTELYLERFDDSIRHLQRGLEVARNSGQGAFIPFMECALALSATMKGDHALGTEMRENAIEAARLTANDFVTATALMVNAWVQLLLAGDIEDALRSAEESVALLRGLDSGAVAGMSAAAYVAAAASAGDTAADVEAVIAGTGGWEMPFVPLMARSSHLGTMADVELAAGNRERAERFTQRAETLAEGVELKLPSAISKRARAALLLAGGDGAGAAALAQASAAIAEAVGARIEAARSRTLAGRAFARAADQAGAVKLLRRAERELDRCGAVGHRDDARRELRRLGVRAEPPALSPRARAVLADLFGELRHLHGETLRAALATALGDPGLDVIYASPDGTLPQSRGDRSVVPVDRDGREFAALVYDASLVDDPELVQAVSAAAAIALENERLQAESQARLAELQASRERIVAAGDAERRRLERNLHDGAQQRLVALAMHLRLIQADIRRDPASAEALVTSASGELAQSLAELRELARGIHPAVLDHGLAAALDALATRSTVPTAVTCEVTERLPAQIELAGYFVACEALANVAKYAQATAASVFLSRTDRGVAIEIADDGIGGADAAAGSGLRGLVDRVEALQGNLLVTSPAGGGTVVTAELPWDS